MLFNDKDIERLEERKDLFSEMIESEAFSLIESRRVSEGNFKHTLQEVLLLWLCAITSGFYTYRKMVLYGELKIDFLRRFFPYEHGIPSSSTIARVIGIIDPSVMNNLLVATVSNCRKDQQLPDDALITIALDGKTHCGTQITDSLKNKLHIVSAFDTSNGITLTQESVPEKTNEITAIKTILSTVAIEGKTITIDAIGTQTEIVKMIRERKGNYILSLKENQKSAYHATKIFFEEEKNLPKIKIYQDLDKGHGRFEKRTIYAARTAQFKGEDWVDLNTIVMVKTETITAKGTTISSRYYITNLAPNGKLLLSAIRSHWMIESAHWTLDVTFNEDDRIIWDRTLAHNEAIVKRIIMNMLQQFREVFRISPGKKEKHSYWGIQQILLAKDDIFESLLRGNFK